MAVPPSDITSQSRQEEGIKANRKAVETATLFFHQEGKTYFKTTLVNMYLTCQTMLNSHCKLEKKKLGKLNTQFSSH